MPQIKKLHAQVKDLIPQAIVLMAEEYNNPERGKLTHFWLAEKLGIERKVAFVLLARVAQRRKYCVRLPHGPIYWDNDLIPVGTVIDLITQNRAKHREE